MPVSSRRLEMARFRSANGLGRLLKDCSADAHASPPIRRKICAARAWRTSRRRVTEKRSPVSRALPQVRVTAIARKTASAERSPLSMWGTHRRSEKPRTVGGMMTAAENAPWRPTYRPPAGGTSYPLASSTDSSTIGVSNAIRATCGGVVFPLSSSRRSRYRWPSRRTAQRSGVNSRSQRTLKAPNSSHVNSISQTRAVSYAAGASRVFWKWLSK